MTKAVVPMLWGHVIEVGADAAVYAGRRTKFPFARRMVQGGDPFRPSTAEIYVCQNCEEAKALWIKQNPQHPWSRAQRDSAQKLDQALEPATTVVTPTAQEPRQP